MPRLSIIILDRPEPANPNVYRYALWADVPAARQSFYAALAGSTAVSAWKDAIAGDTSAIRAGSIVERVDTIQVPAVATVAQIRAFLQARWTTFQSEITTNNPWVRYGSTWDGTTWTAGGIA